MANSTNSLALLNSYTVKTAAQIRADYLNIYLNALINAGVPNPDVGPGTPTYIHATALSNEMAALGYNQQLLVNGALPDSAQGNDMIRQATLVDLSLQPATSSVGLIRTSTTVDPTTPVAIAQGTQLVDSNGQKYQVELGGFFQDGYDVSIISINTGSSVNISGSLKWVDQPAFCNPSVVIEGTLSGGADAESIEDLRARVLNVWRAPSVAGNSAQIAQWATESSPNIQAAFIYAIAGGPGSVFIRLVSTPDPTTKSRALNTRSEIAPVDFIAGVILPYIAARVPEYVELNINDVKDVPTNVSIGLALTPGQWINSNNNNNNSVWPVKVSQGFADVTAVVNSKSFSVNADSAPIAGFTQICWLSPVDWNFYSSLILTVSGSGPGPYQITIQNPFPNIAIGHWISPLAKNSKQYFQAVIDQFAGFGPGQLTDQAGLLPSANRFPDPSLSWPSNVGPSILKYLVTLGSEIQDVQYLINVPIVPALPLSVADKANILIPRNIYLGPIAV